MKNKVIEVECAFCGNKTKKSVSEYNRSNKIGRRHFCNLSCSVKMTNKEHPSTSFQGGKFAGNKIGLDSLSPFRKFTLNAKARAKLERMSVDITSDYLKEVWNNQNGICSLSGLSMILPVGTSGKWNEGCPSLRASLDRIDNSLGYVKGNVRFICTIGNYGKGISTDEEFISFCHDVAKNSHNFNHDLPGNANLKRVSYKKLGKVSIPCSFCGKQFETSGASYERCKAIGKNRFCSRSCASQFSAKKGLKRVINCDEAESPFIFYISRANARRELKGETNLTTQILKEIWESQNGICPFTGWKLALPLNAAGFGKDVPIHIMASLDRVDNSIGYIAGNVRFVCRMANKARNVFSDKQLIDFCKAVSVNISK